MPSIGFRDYIYLIILGCIILFTFGNNTFASFDASTKDKNQSNRAHSHFCKRIDGVYDHINEYGYNNNFSIYKPGFEGVMLPQIIKRNGILYYPTDAFSNAESKYEQSVYSYNCKTKISRILFRETRKKPFPHSYIIDAIDGRYLILRSSESGVPLDTLIIDIATKNNDIIFSYIADGVRIADPKGTPTPIYWHSSNEKQLEPHGGSWDNYAYLDFKPTGIGKGKVLVRVYDDYDVNGNYAIMKDLWFQYDLKTMKLLR